MAGIGLYGVYYSKGTLTDGVLTGYQGVQQMGKAISANFTRATTGDDNDLWANNGIAETDGQASSGGELELNLDRLVQQAQEDLFGLTADTKKVTVGGEEITGSGISETGNEIANVVGVAFIRQHQEENDRGIHEAVIYAYVSFTQPDEEAQTIGADGVTWQTPTISGTVSGGAVTGTYPWRQKYRFPTQSAAVAYIQSVFAAPVTPGE